MRLEKKSKGALRVDLQVHFKDGKRYLQEQEQDHDGHFETRQLFDQPGFSSVLEANDREGGSVRQSYFRDGKLAIQKWDQDMGARRGVG